MNRWLLACALALSAGDLPRAGLCADEAGDTAAPRRSLRQNMADLTRARMTAPSSQPADPELQKSTAELAACQLSRPVAETPAPASAVQQPKPTTAPATQPAPARTESASLEQLRKIPPGTIRNPLAAADAMFAATHREAALALYQLAIAQDGQPENKAWALLQAGNCVRESNPENARKYYQQLIRDYPTSAWSALASTLDKQVEWEATTKSKTATTKPAAPKT